MNYLQKMFAACKKLFAERKKEIAIVGFGVPFIAVPSLVAAQDVCLEPNPFNAFLEFTGGLQSCPGDPAPGPCETGFFYEFMATANPGLNPHTAKFTVQGLEGKVFHQGWYQDGGFKVTPKKVCKNGPAVGIFYAKPNSPTSFTCPSGNALTNASRYKSLDTENMVYVVVDPLRGASAITCPAYVCAANCYQGKWLDCPKGVKVTVPPSGGKPLLCCVP